MSLANLKECRTRGENRESIALPGEEGIKGNVPADELSDEDRSIPLPAKKGGYMAKTTKE